AEKYGIKSGILDFGGNIYCFPKAPSGKKLYQLGVRGPNGVGVHEVFEGVDLFTATSGDYERYRIIENHKFAHIINPLTGHPVKDRAAVVVVTQSGVNSDVLSTAIFVGGSEYGRKLVKERFLSLQFVVVNHKVGSRFVYDHFGDIWKKN
ncbi:MAG: FAD:protein FMN transferase, partial [Lentisphaeria bacterium]